jgi:hypothetical protein
MQRFPGIGQQFLGIDFVADGDVVASRGFQDVGDRRESNNAVTSRKRGGNSPPEDDQRLPDARCITAPVFLSLKFLHITLKYHSSITPEFSETEQEV